MALPTFTPGTMIKASEMNAALAEVYRMALDAAHPVGSIYMSTTLTTTADVEAALGGTWLAWGAGRVPVGMGSNGTTDYTTVEATGGEDEHKLTVSEMPKHGHPWTGVNTGATQTSQMGNYPFRIQQDVQENWAGTEARIGIAGGDAAHENRQPYITVYMYKRTA